MDINKWHKELAYDQWIALPVSDARPSARYKHAAAVADEKLYVFGGNRNGGYLSDFQVFDLRSLTWSSLKLNPNADKADNISGSLEVLPAIAVRFIDLESYIYGVFEASGNIPVARVGHSATLLGSRLIIFGGEDTSRRLLNDVHVLDLESMTWDALNTVQTPAVPRFDHTAAVHVERYLLIFGGCSHSVFFSDLRVLDLQTMEWSQPQIQGDLVTPRAGHAGITFDDNWYIVGGGDNRSGCPETLLLNMTKLVWSVLSVVKQRDPLATEGLSACSASIDGEKYLISFGGYNGKYCNKIFVMRPKPRDSSHPKIYQSPAAAAAAASVSATYGLTKSEKLDFTKLESASPKTSGNGHLVQNITMEIEAIREEKLVLEVSLAGVRAENSRLTGEIHEVNGTHAELSKELQSVQGKLVA